MAKINLITIRSFLNIDEPSVKAEIDAFLKEIDPMGALDFQNDGNGLPIYFVLSGGSESFFQKDYETGKGPYFLLPTGARNSFAASLEILSFLRRRGEKAVLLYDVEKEKIGKKILAYAKAYEAYQALKGMRLGLIGGPSDWLIDSKSDPKKIQKKFGIEMIDIPMEKMMDRVDAHRIGDLKAYEALQKKTKRQDDLRVSFYLYEAISSLCEEYRLNGFSLRCFDLLSAYQNTSCLAFGLLNDRGILASCEGDIPSLLSMAIIHALTGQASFMANPEFLDVQKKQGLYAHCTCPFSMLESYRLMTHFESGLGFGIRGKFKEQEITMAKLDASLDQLLIKKGRIVVNPERDDICRSQILVQFEEDIQDLLDSPFGNHMLFFYGDHRGELEAFSYFL